MDCFKWLEADAPEDCIYAYQRTSGDSSVIVVLNLSDRRYENYTVGVDGLVTVTELINSDSDIYSGTTPLKKSVKIHSEAVPYKKHSYSFKDTFAPFSAKIYSVSQGVEPAVEELKKKTSSAEKKPRARKKAVVKGTE